MLEDPCLQLSGEICFIDGYETFLYSLLNFGTAMTVSKSDAIPTAETQAALLRLESGRQQYRSEFIDLSVHNGETVAFLGLGFHTAPFQKLIQTLEEELCPTSGFSKGCNIVHKRFH